jgi:hypothetical protein
MQAEDASRLASLRELQVYALAHRAKEEAAVGESSAGGKAETISGSKRNRVDELSKSVAFGAGFDGIHAVGPIAEGTPSSKRPRYDSLSSNQVATRTSSDLELAHLLTAAGTGELHLTALPSV